jgi:hypothetical protein
MALMATKNAAVATMGSLVLAVCAGCNGSGASASSAQRPGLSRNALTSSADGGPVFGRRRIYPRSRRSYRGGPPPWP